MTTAKAEGFSPLPWLPGGHLQTIVPGLWPGPELGRPIEALVVRVAEGSSVRVDVARPGEGASRGTVLLIHGLGGSARSGYMIRTARHALSRGWTVALMNLRTCGGTETMSGTFYNAGQSGDADAVLTALEREGLPRPFVAVGFSLGGNLLLRYAGLSGVDCRADAIVGVNAPIDLAACLRELERPRNAIYELHFVLRLCRQVRAVRALRPVPGPPATWRAIRRLRRFDDHFTAPDAGFATASAYYAAASAGPSLAGTRVPTLVLSSANDPFIPVAVFEAARLAAPANVSFLHPQHGGHVGYWQGNGERFWAATAVLDFLERGTGGVRSSAAIS